MSLHLQTDWKRSLGQRVEIRLNGRPVRTGTVEAVMPDDSILWIAAEGADSRKMLARADGFQVFTRYAWTHPEPPETEYTPNGSGSQGHPATFPAAGPLADEFVGHVAPQQQRN